MDCLVRVRARAGGGLNMVYLSQPADLGQRGRFDKKFFVPVALQPATKVHVRAALRRSLYARGGKRLLDASGAVILGVILLPIALATALLVALTMGSPVIYRQRRVGLGGRIFTIYKFRSMLPDRRLGDNSFVGHDRRTCHKSAHDPRHTRVGRILRKWSLDEIPQFLNVLKGEMSLVGPRPELVSVVDGYEDWQHCRHQVRPGLTGPWQVSIQRSVPMHEATGIDLEYLDQVSFLSDCQLLLRTIPALLGRRGA